jgi:hypothetical protein
VDDDAEVAQWISHT